MAQAGMLFWLLGMFAALFVVFLLLREVWCWYWKINDGLRELRRIRAALEEMNERGRARPDQKSAAWASSTFTP